MIFDMQHFLEECWWFHYTNRFFISFLDKSAMKYISKWLHTDRCVHMVVLLTQNTRYTKISNIKMFEVIIMRTYPWKDKIYFAIITLNIKLCAKKIFGYMRKTTSFLSCKNSLVYSNIRGHSLWWMIEKTLTAVNSHTLSSLYQKRSIHLIN